MKQKIKTLIFHAAHKAYEHGDLASPELPEISFVLNQKRRLVYITRSAISTFDSSCAHQILTTITVRTHMRMLSFQDSKHWCVHWKLQGEEPREFLPTATQGRSNFDCKFGNRIILAICVSCAISQKKFAK